jgi:protein phosphatase
MLLHDRGVDVAHVGDSRAYVIRAGQIYPLTRDHSMVQGLIDAGMITEQQAIGHPDANKITRALGMKPEVEVELRPEPMELYPGDVLLMASDGLTDLALNTDILGCTRQALASGPLDHACKMLVQMANDRGGHDNITVQMARVIEAGGRAHTIPGSPAAGSSETIAMTKMETPPPPGAARPLQSSPTAPWGPTVPDVSPTPTAPEAGGAMAVAPAATQVDADPPIARPGRTEPGAPPPAALQPAAALAAYRMEGNPAALPMPPPATAGYVAAAMGPRSPGPAVPYGPAAGMGAPSFAGPTTMSVASARPSRGGIVFVIIGVSAAIAVLLILLLWALLPG